MSPRRAVHISDRLLLDEMLSPRIAELLTSRGVDALSVAANPQLCGASDVEVLTRAVDERRVLVTNNVRDFESLRRARVGFGEPVPSLIETTASAFPRNRKYVDVLVSPLEFAARERLAAWNGGVLWLSTSTTLRARQ